MLCRESFITSAAVATIFADPAYLNALSISAAATSMKSVAKASLTPVTLL
jgi:hypothetical protein